MKTYQIEMPNRHQRGFNLTASELESVKAQCEKGLEQAEAEKPKPKAWDFGLGLDLHMYSGDFWSSGRNPAEKVNLICGRLPILGNLLDIVENQGPIVIGMTEEAAALVKNRLSGFDRYNEAYSRVCVALDRYRKGKL